MNLTDVRNILRQYTASTIPVKATGAEVDTGTNDTKFATPKAIEDSSYIKAAYADAKVSDAAYGAGWNGDTTTAPSKNAVYDKINSMGGGGDLLAANNLSDLANAATALTNLGLTATAAELNQLDGVTLSGNNTGDSATPAETATTIGALIDGATDKTTPVDADNVAITDSAASHILKKVTWANIKATLKTYFDSLYQPLDTQLTSLAGLSYTANALKVVRVNAGATDFELATLTGGGDLVSTNNLSDVSNAGTARTNLGVGTGDSPQFTGINVGHASDTTVTRSAAGVIAVEGVDVPLNAITATHTALQIELGHATDTTITRSSAGIIAVEGTTVPLNSTTNTHTAQQIELGHASDTTITRASAGQIAVEGTNVIMNGGALGTPSGGTLTNCTSLPVAGITASTSTALGVGSIELGHATDTTISRTAAGMAAVEGKGIFTRVILTAYTSGTAATHNFTSGMQYCEVWCTGGGGGGGGARASDGSSQASASGGGGGGTAYIVYTAAQAGTSATYTVGGVANGGGNTGTDGTPGNNSTFTPGGTGAVLTGAGGMNGVGHDNATPAAAFKTGGAGGNGTNGSANFTGCDGGIGWTSTAAMTVVTSGTGGASMWGGAVRQTGVLTLTATAGRSGQTWGSGGSGAAALNATGGAAGGNGAQGIIIIKEYCQ